MQGDRHTVARLDMNMKDLFALLEMRDVFMILIGAGLILGLLFIFSGIQDAIWMHNYNKNRHPFDRR